VARWRRLSVSWQQGRSVQLNVITQDQDRLRKNAQEMPPEAAAYKRYLKKFDDQGDPRSSRLQKLIKEPNPSPRWTVYSVRLARGGRHLEAMHVGSGFPTLVLAGELEIGAIGVFDEDNRSVSLRLAMV